MRMGGHLTVPSVASHSNHGLKFLESLEDEQKFREAVNNNQPRADSAYWWSGNFPVWKNNVIFNHDITIDTAPGRQGSPLAPIAFLGQALANAAPTTITGGGAWNTGGTLTDTSLYDFFSYFGGYGWKTYENETLPVDGNTYYALIYNVSGADKGKYEIVQGLAISDFSRTRMSATEAELRQEREAVASLL